MRIRIIIIGVIVLVGLIIVLLYVFNKNLLLSKPSARTNDPTAITVSGNNSTFHVAVNFGKTLDEMLKAGGYQFVAPDITAANFPISGTGIVENDLILVHLDKNADSKEVLAELTKLDLEPAGIEYAVAFGAQHPDVQREFPIVFLGSVWTGPDGDPYVPDLDFLGDKRRINLDGWLGGWLPECRFAAVRKVVSKPIH